VRRFAATGAVFSALALGFLSALGIRTSVAQIEQLARRLPLADAPGQTMRPLPLLHSLLLALSSSAPGDAAGADLLKPPVPLPTDLPRLAPLLTSGSGKTIHSIAEWSERRAELRREWTRFLGEFPASKAPLKAEFGAKEAFPDHTRQKVTYQIEEGLRTDATLLAPRSVAGKSPAIVVFHPTYSNAYARVIGLETDDRERMHALHLVARGYTVITPRCFIYGDADGPIGALAAGQKAPAGTPQYTANVARMQAQHPGWKGVTRMAWDGVRALDLLASLPQVDANRLGIFGHSLGAKEALYVAAFDERVKCAVSSEGGIGLKFSNWQDAWYLGAAIREPGFAREHHELLALAAPRAFLLLAGESADNDRSWAFIAAARPVYELLGAPRNLGWFNHRLGHRYPPAAQAEAEAFLDAHLK
jgi:dienelactone hydrolase